MPQPQDDPLLAPMLQRATGIGPPTGNWTPLTHGGDPPLVQLAHRVLGDAQRDSQGAPVVGPGDIMGVAGAIKPIRSIEHPAMQELMWMLGNVKAEPQEKSLMKALMQRSTPRTSPTADPIRLPNKLALPGFKTDTRALTSSEWSPITQKDILPPVQRATSVEDLKNIAPSVAVEPRPVPKLSGKWAGRNPRMSTDLEQANLTPDIIRDIRKIGDHQTAMNTYPNVSPRTIKDILLGNSWNTIK